MSPKATPPTIVVRGQAVVRTEPDEASLSIGLNAFAESPRAALEDIAARSQKLSTLLDELEVAEADRATTGVSVREGFERPDHTGRLGYRASVGVAVRLADADLVSRVISRTGEELHAAIEGPKWSVSADSPVHLQAAERAATNARSRAVVYATGIGAQPGRLISLEEPDAGPATHRVTRRSVMPLAAGSDMPIETEDQEVWAFVDATFEMTAASVDSA